MNVDEISTKLDDQLEAMRWLVMELAALVVIRLSIDPSNLEIIGAGVAEAGEVADTRVGPPMLNSAPLERIGALELAALLRGPVVVTAAGERRIPTNTEERVVNASRLLNDAFLVLTIEAGTNSGIVDPTVVNVQRAVAADRTTRPFQLALDVLTGAHENCSAYMKTYRAGELTPSAS